ncbi:MAG: asparaginase [Huintestinicola sp.]
MKRIMWISTGGTISCRKTEKGLAPDNSEAQMKKMAEAVSADCEIVFRDIMNMDSTELSCDDIRKIAASAAEGATTCDGVVITHGTDTMAYTAAMLFYMLENLPVPVILTGSQLPFYEDDSDGAGNLKMAFAAACDERFRGVYILFGSAVIRGDKAHKQYSRSFDAFVSSEDYSARITEGRFTEVNTDIPTGDFIYHSGFCENVMLIKLTPNFDERLIAAAGEMGIKGIVIEGYGLGGIPSRVISQLESIIAGGVRVILISQCFYEGVDTEVYAVGRNAGESGIESGGSMTAECALAKLMIELNQQKIR